MADPKLCNYCGVVIDSGAACTTDGEFNHCPNKRISELLAGGPQVGDDDDVVTEDAMVKQAVARERERCASLCDDLANLMENGAGDPEPGGRLRQAARNIRDPNKQPMNLDALGVDSAVPLSEVLRMRDALDALYNRDDATRKAVIEVYGLHHHPAVARVTSAGPLGVQPTRDSVAEEIAKVPYEPPLDPSIFSDYEHAYKSGFMDAKNMAFAIAVAIESRPTDGVAGGHGEVFSRHTPMVGKDDQA